MKFDTITAIATGTTPAGVGIVRMSGPRALAIGARLLRRERPLPDRRLVYGAIYDEGASEPLDEGFVVAFHAPRSFTGEDVVELQMHGGLLNLAEVSAATVTFGARPAEPGEFSRRAVQNGRLDLTSAEALLDIIEAESKAALRLAHRQLGGAVGEAVKSLGATLEQVLVEIEAALDFPDEEETAFEAERFCAPIDAILAEARRLAGTYRTGRYLRRGFRVVLLGAPNAGKSTLFNALLGDERAIVTATPGTTRDYLEATLDMDGLPVVLVDTAGVRHSEHAIEQEGVKRALAQGSSADLTVLLVDGSRPPSESFWSALPSDWNRGTPLLLTKSDLPQDPAARRWAERFTSGEVIPLSAASGEGLAAFNELVRRVALPGGMPSAETAVISRLRHRGALERATVAMERAREALCAGQTLDVVASDLHSARRALGEIVGEFTTDDVLDRIFERFCIGK